MHAVGTLKRDSSLTIDGIDSNIATSWLSRVQMQRNLVLKPTAASSTSPLPNPEPSPSACSAHSSPSTTSTPASPPTVKPRWPTTCGWHHGSDEASPPSDTGPESSTLTSDAVFPHPFKRSSNPSTGGRPAARPRLPTTSLGFSLTKSFPRRVASASRDGLFEHDEHIHDPRRLDAIEQLADELLIRASLSP